MQRFGLKTNIILFWCFGEIGINKSKSDLTQECFVQMLEANEDKSEKSTSRFPLEIEWSSVAHIISWMPMGFMAISVQFLVCSRGSLHTFWFMPV